MVASNRVDGEGINIACCPIDGHADPMWKFTSQILVMGR